MVDSKQTTRTLLARVRCQLGRLVSDQTLHCVLCSSICGPAFTTISRSLHRSAGEDGPRDAQVAVRRWLPAKPATTVTQPKHLHCVVDIRTAPILTQHLYPKRMGLGRYGFSSGRLEAPELAMGAGEEV